jgi:hypothetical protein
MRVVTFRCFADIPTVARTFVAKLLHHDLNGLPKIPSAYKPRVKVLYEIARAADESNDEPHRREVRNQLKEFVNAMRDSIIDRKIALILHEALEDTGGADQTRVQLEAELDRAELDSLQFDLGVA